MASARARKSIPAPPVTLKRIPELAARHGWRCHHHASGAVAILRTFRRVITDPYFAPAKRAQGQCMKVVQTSQLSTMHACSSLRREHGREIVHKPHISRFWYSSGCTPCATGQVEQVTAAAHRIFHGDYLAVLPVCAQQAGARLLWDRSMSTLSALLRHG